LRRLWRLLGWFVVVDALITMFGVTTAPLLLSLVVDGAIGLLIIRSLMKIRAAPLASPAIMPFGITARPPARRRALLLASVETNVGPQDEGGY
jgi:hypothetical protein